MRAKFVFMFFLLEIRFLNSIKDLPYFKVYVNLLYVVTYLKNVKNLCRIIIFFSCIYSTRMDVIQYLMMQTVLKNYK